VAATPPTGARTAGEPASAQSNAPAPDGGADTLIPNTDSTFDASAFEQSLERREPLRWIGWRLRLLVLAALLGCVVVFVVMRTLATSAHLDAVWQVTSRAQLTLLSSPQDALGALAGRTLDTLRVPGEPPLRLDDLVLQRTARWLVDDARRARYLQMQDRLAELLAHGTVQLRFTDGSSVDVVTPLRGYRGLGLVFWPLTGFALLLYLIGVAVLLLRPNPRNLLYASMAWCQALNLLLIAAEPSRGIGQPLGFTTLDLYLRLSLDVLTAAAALCAYALHPQRVPRAGLVATGAVTVALVWAVLAFGGWLPQLWTATQAVVLSLGTAATAVIAWSYRLWPNPFVAVMRRFTFIAVATLGLVTLSVAATHRLTGTVPAVAAVGAVIWYLFFASLLLLVPFLSQSRRVLREFALLAGIGTVATSLDLIFVALFALGPVASIGLALALALAVYVVARQWILTQMVGASVLTTERTFEQLYRVAREVQDTPEHAMQLLSRLLHDLFEPLEMLTVPRRLAEARVVGAGSALYVPLPGEAGQLERNQVLVMRYASHGKRIFTDDDAHLADRVVDQVCRAVAYDRAVEQGRSEERLRIAQDLHDDIGARLLTLMYKAGDREMEDYIRHTLQDLKTLTRGLAATHHPLSHAAGEWKADLAQRLTAAHLRFGWSFQSDRDVTLSVVQWSGLTRVLRELVSNAIYHAQASRVDVSLHLDAGVLTLRVGDDGKGGDPSSWSHGLGLGGVRKRVRTLGGSVSWRDNGGHGILCEVTVPGLGLGANT
jgi:signal transduction histidine kinase